MKKEILVILLTFGILTACTIVKKQTRSEQLVLDRTQTVAGIDQDHNGIRDDVDAFIKRSYPSAAQQKAASQYAKGVQASLLVNKQDRHAVKATTDLKARAISCIFENFPNGKAANNESVVGEIVGVTTNTKQRLRAYAELDLAIDGEVSSLPTENVCDS